MVKKIPRNPNKRPCVARNITFEVSLMRYIPRHEKLFVGQERVIKKFLLLPKKLGKEVRWLERVKIRQKVEALDFGGSMEWGKYKNCWVDIEFVN